MPASESDDNSEKDQERMGRRYMSLPVMQHIDKILKSVDDATLFLFLYP